MAKKKRKRPHAGPPAVRNPRVGAKPAAAAPPARPGRAADGRPIPLSFRGIAIRALFAAALFFVYVLVVSDLGPGSAAYISMIAFVLMIPVGLLMDRAIYRVRLRRWLRQTGG